jgi:hypothetical protein
MRTSRDQSGIPQCLHDSNTLTGRLAALRGSLSREAHLFADSREVIQPPALERGSEADDRQP